MKTVTCRNCTKIENIETLEYPSDPKAKIEWSGWAKCIFASEYEEKFKEEHELVFYICSKCYILLEEESKKIREEYNKAVKAYIKKFFNIEDYYSLFNYKVRK